MIVEKKTLLEELHQRQSYILQSLRALRETSDELLRKRPGPDQWSALECLEHLNQTYRHYCPAIAKALQNSKTDGSSSYKEGFMGRMMTNSMSIVNGQNKRTMKTFRSMVPDVSNQSTAAIFEQLEQFEKQMADFVQQASHLSLSANRVPSAIGPIIRFKLGDCLRFMVAHDERHLLQAQKALIAATKA